MRRSLALTVSAACALTFGVGQAFADTLIVDDDRAQCPHAAFTSIQAAVTAASTGDAVEVCPGAYNELVTITRPNLTLKAATPLDVWFRSGDTTREAVVTGSLGAFRVEEDEIKIEDFTFFGPGAGGRPRLTTTSTFSGHELSRNLFELTNAGLSLQTSGAMKTVVKDNLFRRNSSAMSSGYYDGGTLRNVEINGNRWRQNSSPLYVNPSAQDVLIKGNEVVGQYGIFFNQPTGIEIKDNVIRGGAGVFIFGGSDVRIVGNQINGTFGDGILLGGYVGLTTSLVASNTVTSASRSGIALQIVSDTRIIDNRLELNLRDGIMLDRATNTLVRNNVISWNQRDGVRVNSLSVGNTIARNLMQDNREHDAHDDSVGPGTAGTANFWFGNDCLTENRSGLCTHSGLPREDAK